MSKKNLDLKVWTRGLEIKVECVYINDNLRGHRNIFVGEGLTIESYDSPCWDETICPAISCLYLPGENKEEDHKPMRYIAPNEDNKQIILNDIKKALKHINAKSYKWKRVI